MYETPNAMVMTAQAGPVIVSDLAPIWPTPTRNDNIPEDVWE